MTALTLTVAGSATELDLRPARLVVAGYTGRDEASVRAHIDELAAIGVPPPSSVPAFFELDPALLTDASTVDVASGATSGEVEPVFVRHDGRWYLTVGSDHTDRELERTDITRAKAACPKPLGTTVVPLPGDDRWDEIGATCTVDGQPYQQGTLAELRTPGDLLPRLPAGAGGDDADLVVYAGTLPLLTGAFVHGTSWELRLDVPAAGTTLTHTYAVKRRT